MPNILTDNIFTAELNGSRRQLSLPAAFAALMSDNIDYFPNIRPFQRHPWHAFLSQVGALALINAATTKPPKRAPDWRYLLLDLVPEYPNSEPWRLIVDDPSLPALLQPPASDISEYKTKAVAPDEIDVVITSKNLKHKMAAAANAAPEDWIYALVSAQTQDGFSGVGNYGVYRMNGGLGSRCGVSLAPSLRPGAAVRRDIEALAALYAGVKPSRLISLLWTLPWNGSKADSINGVAGLHPLCVEICRRLRLISEPDGIRALKATSRAPRVAAKDLKGDVSDPWTPISRAERKSLSVSARGFNRRLIFDLMTQERWELPHLAKPSPQELNDGDLTLVLRAIARGQGKTEGYHERFVPIGMRARAAIADPDSSDMIELRAIIAERAEIADAARRIASHAIYLRAASGDADMSIRQDDKAAKHLSDLAAAIDDLLLIDALAEMEEPDKESKDARRAAFIQSLADLARRALAQARAEIPLPASARRKADAVSQDALENRLARELLPPKDDSGPPNYQEPSVWARGALAHSHSLRAYAAYAPQALNRLIRAKPGSKHMREQLRQRPITQDLSPQDEHKWSIIVRGIAITTPRQSKLPEDEREAHDPRTPLGRALYQGGQADAAGAYYSESKLCRLLESTGAAFHDYLLDAAISVARKNARFNWIEVAELIGEDDPEKRERNLNKIARDYYRAQKYAQSQRAA